MAAIGKLGDITLAAWDQLPGADPRSNNFFALFISWYFS